MRRALLIIASVLACTTPAGAAEPAHDHDATPAPVPAGARVGLLLADHGEPPVYNADTYWSFRDFVDGLMDAGVIPPQLRLLDTGTITHPYAGSLVDAWLRPHDGPGVPVPESSSIGAHQVLPAGPGLREPDIFEHAGLQTWQEYRQMGGRSPNYDEKLPRTRALIRWIKQRYGPKLAVRTGHMIDPRINGRRQGIREAIEALVRRDRAEVIVIAYMGVGFSDIMQTHHLRHHVAETLAELGQPDLPLRYAKPLGTTDAYVNGIVKRVQAELDALPADAKVAVHLSGHGLPTGTCGEYDCGADAYHRSSADLFARTYAALHAKIKRAAPWEAFHLYGEGASPDDDEAGEVHSPLEALAKRKQDGYTHVVDVPHEFDANSRDTLVVLREGYDREAPDWNAKLESYFDWEGIAVKLANATGGDHHKILARQRVVADALRGLVPADYVPAKATVEVHDDHFHPAKVRVARGGTVSWRWMGDNKHDVVIEHAHGAPHVAAVPARTSGFVRRRFEQAGTYRYLCTLHEGMRGQVSVR